MNELKEILILFSLLIVPVGISLFESVYGKWFKETDQAKRDKISSVWHAVKFWIIVLSTLNIFWANQLTAWFIYLPLMMSIFWILFDLWYNWRHNWSLLYPGNGRGGFIEGALYWLSKRIGLNFTITMILVKLIILGCSIFIIIKF